jgi:hypothetical protein
MFSLGGLYHAVNCIWTYVDTSLDQTIIDRLSLHNTPNHAQLPYREFEGRPRKRYNLLVRVTRNIYG